MRLIEQAVELGIRYFDTAPSYGDGASERILGRALSSIRRDVQLCSKIGFPRPRPNAAAAAGRAALRAVLKPVARRVMRGKGAPARRGHGAAQEHGTFAVDRLSAEVGQSLDALRTDHLDCLMLHEPRLTDPSAELAAALRALADARVVARLGVGTGSTLDALPLFGEVAQCALSPALLTTRDSRALIAHGVFRSLDARVLEDCAAGAGLLEQVPSLRRHLRDTVGSGALLLNAVLRGTRVERVLWSTSSAARLRLVLCAAVSVDEELAAASQPGLEAACTETLRRYLAYGVQAAR